MVEKPYQLNPKINTQFGEVIVSGSDPDSVHKTLLDALDCLTVVKGETNIELVKDLLVHPDMQGTPDIHTMERVISERQETFKHRAKIEELEARRVQIALDRSKMTIEINRLKRQLPPIRSYSTASRMPVKIVKFGFKFLKRF